MKTIIAKKKYGQNFLKDESVLQQIIEAMPNNNNKIVEIGPGLGDLTKYLVDVKSVEAFEVDADLCKILQDSFDIAIKTNRLTLRCGDVLSTWKSNLLDEPYDLVANLPYYIATNIILKALADENCKNILVMVQLEVAQKFCASSGDSDFGALSVIAQSIANTKLIIKVPPTSFDPQPKVDSAVFLIEKKESRKDEDFEKFLRVAFTQPRKTLLKNLSSTYNKERLIDTLKTLGVSQTIRPHELSTSDYHQLYNNSRSLDATRRNTTGDS
ncbi:MAG: 16S rRNA (adenine(1518)-N(6)/adenine(1519)-N(6))-dimethyltransferase RsmA [Sulfurimonas sp.]|jgi:16S rRNA (adenine1518-N6/adenine1519-N6)-dimethyltransferase|nr:16S rRNA (adenine(1518)-N(6)/adenine(1519)-N(6))-dimethyltransferase RsmA [Sulfurimonadaceae bacterium]